MTTIPLPKPPRKSTSPDAKLRRRARELETQIAATLQAADPLGKLILPKDRDLPPIYRQLARLQKAVLALQQVIAARVLIATR